MEGRLLRQGPFWVDAICIDQGNIQQHNHQVRQMVRIYRTAKIVFIWPGSILLALELLMDVVFSRSNVRPIFRHLFVKIAKTAPCFENLLQKLEDSQYWERTWISQFLSYLHFR